MIKYKIVYGNRRFNACKKLGWKTIEAKIDGGIAEILKISDITTFKNCRTSNNGINLLMQSIRDNGLLEPIGLTKSKTFGVNELILNGVENLQRKEISRLQQGKLFKKLRDEEGLTCAEIGSRFAFHVRTIENNIKYFETIPKGAQNSIGEYDKIDTKQPINEALIVATYGKCASKKIAKRVLSSAIKKKWSVGKTRKVSRLCSAGLAFEQAKKDEYVTLKSEVPVNAEVMTKMLKKHKLTRTKLVRGMLKGEIPLNKKLVV